MVSTDPASIIDEFLSRCITSRSLKLGKALHSNFVKTVLNFNYFIVNRLIDLYSKCSSIGSVHKAFEDLPFKNARSWNTIVSASSKLGMMEMARKLFDEMPEPNLVSYNSMISGLSRAGYYAEALGMFRRLQEDCVGGFWLDEWMNERDVVSWTLMVAASTRASRLDDANSLFNQMPHRNTIAWTSLMAVFSQNGQNLALLGKGKQIHEHVVKSFNQEGFGSVYANNVLLDMYCKCGDMGSSKKLFEGMVKKDVVSWNSMINGFAHNGLADESLIVFKEMVQGTTVPNHVTFLGVLLACSHTGSLSEALQILEQMEDHVGIWGAILGACQIHQHVDLAMKAVETLFKMEHSNPGRYVMLTNIYTAANKWSDACKDNPVLKTLSKLMNDLVWFYSHLRNCQMYVQCHCEMRRKLKAPDKV
ncbi:Pentatricopeptide repeat-containing protein At3g29230 [Linum perenne]